MKPRDKRGMTRRKIVAERLRAFHDSTQEQAGLPELQQRIAQRMQPQPEQQQQSKAEPDDE